MIDPHEIIDQLSHGDALAVLKALAREDDQLAAHIAERATLYLSNVDPEEVAAVLYDQLTWLEVEEVVEPFLQKLRKYQKLGMRTQANQMCMGLLLGLYQFESESKNELSLTKICGSNHVQAA